MLSEWAKVVQDLNTNRNHTNIERAEKIVKKYRVIGLILKIIGIISIILSLGSFITFSIISIDYGFIILIVSGLLFPISAAFIGFGVTHTRIANRVEILLKNPPLFPNVENNRCPSCGDIIKYGEVFCSKCGKKLEKICPKCGYSNDYDNNFCEKCGQSL